MTFARFARFARFFRQTIFFRFFDTVINTINFYGDNQNIIYIKLN